MAESTIYSETTVTPPSSQAHIFSASPTPAASSAPAVNPQPWYLDQDPHFLPAWARSHVKYAQNLLESSNDPIEYDHDEEDYRDNCFFFPEDCVYRPSATQADGPTLRDWASNPDGTETDSDQESNIDEMSSSMLASIRMLDTLALTDLLEDNLSPPEITSIL